MEHRVVSTAHSSTPVQGECKAEAQALDHGHRIYAHFSYLPILETFFEKVFSLFRRRFKDSLKGDVPMVVPAVLERTYSH